MTYPVGEATKRTRSMNFQDSVWADLGERKPGVLQRGSGSPLPHPAVELSGSARRKIRRH